MRISVQFSRSVMSDFLQPHEPQHTRPPCPSQTHKVHPNPVYPKGDQSWVFTGRSDVEAETPILWPPDAKSWLIWKDLDAGKDWGQEEKGTTEDEMVVWHHRLNGHGFGWTLGVSDGQGGLACCSSWCPKESDMTQRLNWTELNWTGVRSSYFCFVLHVWLCGVEYFSMNFLAFVCFLLKNIYTALIFWYF